MAKLEEADDSGKTLHPPIAKHILCIMIRGLFIDLRFPFAHFPTKELTGECFYNIMYEALEHLETIGFKVIALTGDGASPNRNFLSSTLLKATNLPSSIAIHMQKKNVIYIFHLRCTTFNENDQELLVPFVLEWQQTEIMGSIIQVIIYTYR